MAYLPLAFATTIWCSSCGLKRVGDVGDTGDENLITGGISTPRAPPLDAHPQPREWTSPRAQLSNFLGQLHAVYDLVRYCFFRRRGSREAVPWAVQAPISGDSSTSSPKKRKLRSSTP